MRKKLLVMTICLIICCVNLSGCEGTGHSERSEYSTGQESSTATETNRFVTEGMIRDLVKSMSVEEKAGQLFIVCTDSLNTDESKTMTDSMKKAIETYRPGGIIFFSYNLESVEQTKKLLSDVQGASNIPMFLAIDEEGGTVERLGQIKDLNMLPVPSMAEVGMTKDHTQAYVIGSRIAVALKGLGFNLNFAPVADICDVDDNTEIGSRSFGSDPELVAAMVKQEVLGLQDQGISATLKHFPGQGNLKEDTHKGYANIDTTIDKLRKEEFLPFEAGIKAGADVVMMSHASVKAITQSETPASLSKLMVTDILKGEFDYDGLIVTDAMNMKVITKFYDSGQAALMALNAGVDLILMPDHFEEAVDEVVNAVESGEFKEKDLNEIVERILHTKVKRGILTLDSHVFEQVSK